MAAAVPDRLGADRNPVGQQEPRLLELGEVGEAGLEFRRRSIERIEEDHGNPLPVEELEDVRPGTRCPEERGDDARGGVRRLGVVGAEEGVEAGGGRPDGGGVPHLQFHPEAPPDSLLEGGEEADRVGEIGGFRDLESVVIEADGTLGDVLEEPDRVHVYELLFQADRRRFVAHGWKSVLHDKVNHLTRLGQIAGEIDIVDGLAADRHAAGSPLDEEELAVVSEAEREPRGPARLPGLGCGPIWHGLFPSA